MNDEEKEGEKDEDEKGDFVFRERLQLFSRPQAECSSRE